MTSDIDSIDRKIINTLQGGFPISERPYGSVADKLGLAENDLIARIGRMLDDGILSRFGPMYNAERLGGAVTLAALAVPEEKFKKVTELVNEFPEVAHNYRRNHKLNMWFVVSCDTPERVPEVLSEIEDVTGLQVLNLPKEEEFFLELKFQA
jgi:siroheme decarboxylase